MLGESPERYLRCDPNEHDQITEVGANYLQATALLPTSHAWTVERV